MFYTTLARLRKENACSPGMETLWASFPKKPSETKLISLAHILKSNGLYHAIWALRATTEDSRKATAWMIIEFTYQNLGDFERLYPADRRPRKSLIVAVNFLNGKATLEECESAWNAADSARDAAFRAARSAEPARSAARSARSAWSAARSAWSAARSASDSAESAVRIARSARAAVAVSLLATAGAESAARSARAAAAAAFESSGSAGREAAEKKQKEIFLKFLK